MQLSKSALPYRKSLIHRLLSTRKVDVKPEAIDSLKNLPPSPELLELELLMRPA